jgi:hypothetical protein
MKLADNLNDHLPVTYSDFILLCPTPTIDAEPIKSSWHDTAPGAFQIQIFAGRFFI